MPFIDVKIFENRLSSAEVEQELIERLTDAVAEVFGDEIREQTWVVLDPVPKHRWGIAGRSG